MSLKDAFEQLAGKPQSKKQEAPAENVEPVEAKSDEQEEAPAQEAAPAQEEEVDLETLKQRSKESIEDEIKKLREENKKRRLENNALKEQAAILFEEEKKAMESELKKRDEQIKKFQKLMDDLATKADKKQEEVDSAAEVAHTKTQLVELQAKEKELEALAKKFSDAQSRLKEIEDQKKEEENIRKTAYQNKIDEILKTIPEDKQKFAQKLVKGADDIQDGYFALLEAKNEKIFDNKVIEVSHAVPKGDSSSDREQSKPLNNKQRISQGLRSLTSGGIKPGDRLV